MCKGIRHPSCILIRLSLFHVRLRRPSCLECETMFCEKRGEGLVLLYSRSLFKPFVMRVNHSDFFKTPRGCAIGDASTFNHWSRICHKSLCKKGPCKNLPTEKRSPESWKPQILHPRKVFAYIRSQVNQFCLFVYTSPLLRYSSTLLGRPQFLSRFFFMIAGISSGYRGL